MAPVARPTSRARLSSTVVTSLRPSLRSSSRMRERVRTDSLRDCSSEVMRRLDSTVELRVARLVGEVGDRHRQVLEVARAGDAQPEPRRRPAAGGEERQRDQREPHAPAPGEQCRIELARHAGELVGHLQRGARPELRVRGEEPPHQRGEPPREALPARLGRRTAVEDGAPAAHHREGHGAGQHAEEQDAQAEQVGALVLGLAPALLGGHVTGSAALGAAHAQDRARPKSSTLMPPPWPRKTFPGLRSR